MRSTVRYSEALKLHVLRELEEGKFSTSAAAARAYGIRGQGTIGYLGLIEPPRRVDLIRRIHRSSISHVGLCRRDILS